MKKLNVGIILTVFCIVISNIIVLQPLVKADEPVLTLTYGDEHLYYTLNDLLAFDSITGNGGRLKVTGEVIPPNEYTGVLITTLAQEFTDMSSRYSVTAIASDGYIVNYTSDEIQGEIMVYDMNGTEVGIGGVNMIIATMENGLTNYSGSLRIAFVNDDEPITMSYLWAKYVVELKFIPPPAVTITKPEKAIYLSDKKLISFPFTIIIGAITIDAEMNTNLGISRVVFTINDEIKYETNSSASTYTWLWDERAIGFYTINVTAYDNIGNVNTALQKVFILHR